VTTLVAVAFAAPLARAQEPEPDAKPTPPPTTPAAPGDLWKAGTLGISVPFVSASGIFFPAVVTTVPSAIDVLYFLNGNAALDLIVGIDLYNTQIANPTPPPVTTGKTFFGFALGGGYRMYKHKGAMHGYIEPKVVLVWPDVSNDNFLALRLAFDFGAERTIADWFSISGAIGGGVAFGGSNGFTKDINIATTALLAANFYWR
jgi:hypothetical protein